MEVAITYFGLMTFHRQRLHAPLRIGHTAIRQRAHGTIRTARHTLQSPQLHDGLVIAARTLGIQQLTSQLRELLFPFRRVNRCIQVEQTSQHPIDIAIHYRVRLPPRKRDDSRRRVSADPFQGEHLVIASGELSPIMLDNPLGGGMQVACPTIIP